MTDAPSQREPLSVADVLERTADLIEPEGAWAKGAWARDSGIGRPISRCMACAISQVKKYDISPEIAASGFRTLNDMTRWNDAPDRTQAEVVAKLREASARARGEVL